MRARTALAAAVMLPTSFAAAQADVPTLFAAHFFSGGATIASFTIAPSGELTLVGNFLSGIWSDSMALSPDGSTLAVGNLAGSDDGSSTLDDVYFFNVNADSSLSLIGFTQVPSSPAAMEWLDNDTIFITRTDISNTVLSAYDVNLATGTLAQVDQLGGLGFCNSLEIDRERGVIYGQDTFTDAIFRIEYDAAGNLVLAGDVNTGFFTLDLALAPDGSAIYAAAGISGDVVTGYELNTFGPEPFVPLPGSPFPSAGDSPAHTAIVPDSGVFCLGHGTDATVRTYTIDGVGSLTDTGNVFDIGSQGDIGDMAAFRDLLFVTDDSLFPDDIRGVYVFKVGQDGSLSQVGEVYDTGNVRPEGDLLVWSPAAEPCLADVNGDGELTGADFNAWLGAFNDGDPAADQNGDGQLTGADFNSWLGNFSDGCP